MTLPHLIERCESGEFELASASSPQEPSTVEKARAAVERLANVQMNISLEEWSELSSAILAALPAGPIGTEAAAPYNTSEAHMFDAETEPSRLFISQRLDKRTPPPAGAADRIADATLTWMIEHGLLDAGNEYDAAEVLTVLDDLVPTPAERCVFDMWQDISTAPKDGTRVRLAWCPEDWTTAEGLYRDGEWIAAPLFYRAAKSRPRHQHMEFREHRVSPTYWMPLAAPPQALENRSAPLADATQESLPPSPKASP